jgi:urease accessory protein
MWHASLSLGFERREGRTVLADRVHEGPLVVQKPLYPEGGAVCHSIIVHPPGGIAGGDRLSLDAAAAAGACVVLTTPGAAKWYRSAGARAHQIFRFSAGEDACIEWLPQESIFFDGALAESTLEVRLARGARYIGWEVLCFGRGGSGERFTRGEVRLRNRLVVDDELIWMEAGRLAGADPLLQSPAGLGGASVWGTLVAAGPALADIPLNDARAMQPREGSGAVTRLPGALLARYLGDSSEAAKQYFAGLWSLARPALTGRPACPPRIWNT